LKVLKGKTMTQGECVQKWGRATEKWSIVVNVVLIPIWASFLIIFMSSFSGDVLNIIYFALAPFDEMFSGVLNPQFLLNINGIMLSTHKKSLKYRTVINSIFKTAFIMNIVMMVIQFVMIVLMVERILLSTYFSNKERYYPAVVGDVVIILFFAFDFSANV
jgi:hypothetical protein